MYTSPCFPELHFKFGKAEVVAVWAAMAPSLLELRLSAFMNSSARCKKFQRDAIQSLLGNDDRRRASRSRAEVAQGSTSPQNRTHWRWSDAIPCDHQHGHLAMGYQAWALSQSAKN